MRHAGRKRRIERVNVERNVNRCVKLQLQIPDQIPHLNRLNAKLSRLLTLIRSERSNPDLHESLCKFLFHDAREWRSVRITIALVAVVTVRMRAERRNAQV